MKKLNFLLCIHTFVYIFKKRIIIYYIYLFLRIASNKFFLHVLGVINIKKSTRDNYKMKRF